MSNGLQKMVDFTNLGFLNGWSKFFQILNLYATTSWFSLDHYLCILSKDVRKNSFVFFFCTVASSIFSFKSLFKVRPCKIYSCGKFIWARDWKRYWNSTLKIFSMVSLTVLKLQTQMLRYLTKFLLEKLVCESHHSFYYIIICHAFTKICEKFYLISFLPR